MKPEDKYRIHILPEPPGKIMVELPVGITAANVEVFRKMWEADPVLFIVGAMEIADHRTPPSYAPHVCPLCKGHLGAVTCQACTGKGIVWPPS